MSPPSAMTQPEAFQELRGRVNVMEQVVLRIELSTASIATSLQTLARLEERHAEVRASLDTALVLIEKQREQITSINTILAADLPPLKETRSWVIMAVLSALGLILVALATLVIHGPL